MIKTGDYDRIYLYRVYGTDYQPRIPKNKTKVTNPITYIRTFIQWNGFENKYIPSTQQATAVSTQIIKVNDKKCKIVLLEAKQQYYEERVDSYQYHYHSKYQGAIFYFDTRKDITIVQQCLKNKIEQINQLQNYVLLQKSVILVSNRANDCKIKMFQVEQLASKYGLRHYSVCLQQNSDVVQMFEDLVQNRLQKEQILNQTNSSQQGQYLPSYDYYYDRDTFYRRYY